MAFLTKWTREFFEGDDWPLTVHGESVFASRFRGDGESFNIIIQVFEDRRTIHLYSVSPIEASETTFGVAAEFIARANYGMIAPSFELNYDDGDIRVKTVLDFAAVPDDAISGTVFRGLLRQVAYTNVATLDRYLPALRDCLEGKATPQAAIAAVEGT